MITLTSTAVSELQKIMTEKELPNHILRVFVAGGGCSGLSYRLAFAEKPETDDQVYEVDGMRVVVDPVSFQYLDGAQVDYINDVMGGGFRVENPNIVQSCACGSAGEQGPPPCGH